MAKKAKTDVGDIHLDDDLNFAEFDYGAADGSFSSESKKSKTNSKRTVVGDVFTGVLGGAKNAATDPQFIKQGLRDALPRQYETVFTTVDDVAREATSLYDDTINKVKPKAADLARRIDRLVPEESKGIKKITSKFKELTGAGDERTVTDERSNRESQTIDNELAALFNKNQDKADAFRARDRAETAVKDKIRDNRDRRSLLISSEMAQDINTMKSFTETVTTGYYKKNLEIQMRSYFLQAEMLRSQQELGNIMQKQLEAVVKNTALPEFAKVTMSERFRNQAKERFVGGFFGEDNFVKRAFKRIRADIEENVNGLVEGLGMTSDMLGQLEDFDAMQKDMADMGMETESKTKMVSGMAGAGLAGWLRNKATAPIRERLKGTKIDKKGWEAYVKLKNAGAYGNDYVNDEDGQVAKLAAQMGYKGKLADFARYLAKISKDDNIDGTLTKKAGVETIHEAAMFTNKFQRSVEEVMPSLLSAIHRELYLMRNPGTADVGSLTYDFDTGKLVNKGQRIANISKTINKKLTDSSSVSYARGMATFLKGDQKVSASVEDELREMMASVSLNSDQVYERDGLVGSDQYKKLSKEAREVFQRAMDRIDSSDNRYHEIAKLQDMAQAYRRTMNDPRNLIDTYHKLGYTDDMLESGILKRNKDGSIEIDVSRLKDLKTNQTMLGSAAVDKADAIRKVKVTDLNGYRGDDLDPGTGEKKLRALITEMLPDAPRTKSDIVSAPETSVEDMTPPKTERTIMQGQGPMTTPTAEQVRQNRQKNILTRRSPKKPRPPRKPGSGLLGRSDINLKDGIQSIDSSESKFSPAEALKGITDTRLYKWFYKQGAKIKGKAAGLNPNVAHIGPMAQDVNRNLGEDAAPNGTQLDFINMNGVTMAAIQELDRKIEKGGAGVTNRDYLNAIRLNTQGMLEQMKNFGAVNLTLGNVVGRLSNGFDRAIQGLDQNLNLVAQALGSVEYSKHAKDLGGALQNLGGSAYQVGKQGVRTAWNTGKEGLKMANKASVYGRRFIRKNILNQKNKERMADAVSFTYNKAKDAFLYAVDTIKTGVTEVIPSFLKKSKNFVDRTLKKIVDVINGPADVYIRGYESPVMTERRMARGLYFDSQSGTPISSVQDIFNSKGNITDATGKVVLTQEDIADGLYDKDGNKLRGVASKLSHLAAAAAIGAVKFVKDKATKIAGGLVEAGRGGLDMTKALFGKMGAYVDSKLSAFNIGTGAYDERIYRVLVEMRGLMRGENPDRHESLVGSNDGLSGLNGAGKGSGTTTASGTLAPDSSPSPSPAAKSETVNSSTPNEPPPRQDGKADTSALSGLGTLVGKAAQGTMGGLSGGLAGMKTGKGWKGKLAGFFSGAASGAVGGVTGKDVPEGGAGQALVEELKALKDKHANNPTMGMLNGFMARARNMVPQSVSNIVEKGKAAFNDRDGSGRRDGSWEDRIQEQQQKAADREANKHLDVASTDPRYQGGPSLMGMLGKAGSFLGSAAGILASGAEMLGMAGLAAKLRKGGKGAAADKLEKAANAATIADAAKGKTVAGKAGRFGGFLSKLKGHGGKLALLGLGASLLFSSNANAGESQGGEGEEEGSSFNLGDLVEYATIGAGAWGALKMGGSFLKGRFGSKDKAEEAAASVADAAGELPERKEDGKRKRGKGKRARARARAEAARAAPAPKMPEPTTKPGLWQRMKNFGTAPGMSSTAVKSTTAVAEGAKTAATAANAAKNVGTAANVASKAGWGMRALGAIRTAGAVSTALGVVSGSGTLSAIGLGLQAAGVVLGSPIALGAIAVAGVGAAAYFGIKYLTRNSLNDFEKIRLMQYGFANSDEANKLNHKLLSLEEFLLDGKIIVGSDGTPQLNPRGFKAEEIFKIFDIDPADTKMVEKFTSWFQRRFKVYFLGHIKACFDIDRKLVLNKIHQADNEVRKKYLTKISFPGGPADIIDSPFKEIPYANSNLEEVDFLIKKKLEEIDRQMAPTKKRGNPMRNMLEAQKKAEEDKDKKAQAEATQVVDSKKLEDSQAADRIKAANAVAAATPGAVNTVVTAATQSMAEEGKEPKAGSPVESPVAKSAAQRAFEAGGPLAAGSDGMQYVLLGKGVSIDSLNPVFMKQFLGMAEEYGKATGKKIQVNSGSRTSEEQARLYQANPDKAARPGSSLHEFGLALDIQSVAMNELDKMGLLRKYGFTRPIGGETWHMEPAGIQVNIARAKKDRNWASAAIEAGIGRGGGGYGSVPKSPVGGRNPEMALKLLDIGSGQPAQAVAKSDNAALPEPHVAKAASEPAAGSVSASMESKGTTNSTQATSAKETPPAAQAGSGGFSAKTMSPDERTVAASKQESDSPNPNTSTAANDANGKVSPPQGSKELKDAIATNARKAGADPAMMQTFAAVESSMNPNAKAKSTSATGLFQFLSKTWQWVVGRKGKKYGITANDSPTEVDASTLMASEYVKDNLNSLKSVAPNGGVVEAYLAHFLGPGGAKTFLKASPNAVAAQILPDAANANKSIFFDGTRPRTIAQVYSLIAAKLDKAAREFGISGNVQKSMPTNGSPSKEGGSEEAAAPESARTMLTNDVTPSKTTVVKTPTRAPTAENQSAAEMYKPASTDYVQERTTSTKPKVEETTQASSSGIGKILDDSLSVQRDILTAIQDLAKNMDPKRWAEAVNSGKQSAAPAQQAPSNPSSSGPSKQPLPPGSFDLKRSA